MYPREASPSYLVRTAIGLPVKGDAEASIDSACVMCGRQIEQGELCQRWFDNGSFMDWAALSVSVKHTGHVCQDCQALREREGMQKYTRHVACAEGLFPVAKFDHRAYFLLHPPEPPFVFGISTTKNCAHLWWRASVSYSQDVFTVQLLKRQLTIRRRLLDGLPEAVDEFRKLNYEKPGRQLPFVFDSECKDPMMGAPKDAMTRTAAQWPGDLRQRLQSLGLGEIWALGIICIAQNPTKPESESLTTTGV